MSYPQQKFYEAVTCLVSEGPLRTQLVSAAQYLVTLQPTDFTGKDAKHLKAWERIRNDLILSLGSLAHRFDQETMNTEACKIFVPITVS